MKRLTALFLVLVSLLLVAVLIAPMANASNKSYFEYETYKKLLALCPELKDARLEGLLPAAEDLWSKGQLRMPEETHLFRGDFNHDGVSECAAIITSGGTKFLLVAELTRANVWKRNGLVRVKNAFTSWNGQAFVIPPDGFVAWNAGRYALFTGALARYGYAYEPSDFGGVMIKLNYVGPQDEPYPGLLISSYYRFPNISEFKAHRKPRVHYGNDDMPALWHLTLSPGQLRSFIETLNNASFTGAAEDRKGDEAGISHSLSILDTSSSMRPNFYEVFVKSKEAVELLNTFSPKLSKSDKQGSALLQEYSKMFGN